MFFYIFRLCVAVHAILMKLNILGFCSVFHSPVSVLWMCTPHMDRVELYSSFTDSSSLNSLYFRLHSAHRESWQPARFLESSSLLPLIVDWCYSFVSHLHPIGILNTSCLPLVLHVLDTSLPQNSSRQWRYQAQQKVSTTLQLWMWNRLQRWTGGSTCDLLVILDFFLQNPAVISCINHAIIMILFEDKLFGKSRYKTLI